MDNKTPHKPKHATGPIEAGGPVKPRARTKWANLQAALAQLERARELARAETGPIDEEAGI
jgi:hypothetical protein